MEIETGREIRHSGGSLQRNELNTHTRIHLSVRASVCECVCREVAS